MHARPSESTVYSELWLSHAARSWCRAPHRQCGCPEGRSATPASFPTHRPNKSDTLLRTDPHHDIIRSEHAVPRVFTLWTHRFRDICFSVPSRPALSTTQHPKIVSAGAAIPHGAQIGWFHAPVPLTAIVPRPRGLPGPQSRASKPYPSSICVSSASKVSPTGNPSGTSAPHE